MPPPHRSQGADTRTVKTLNEEFPVVPGEGAGAALSGASRVSVKTHGKGTSRKGLSSAESLRGWVLLYGGKYHPVTIIR